MTTTFELILDDSSPVINYFPFAETLGAANLSAGWNSFFSQSGFLSQLGETGIGQTVHITSLDNAVFTIPWFGTGISLFGSAVDATYELSLDGAAPSPGLPRGDLLAGFQDLPLKQHLVALIAHPTHPLLPASSFLSFDRAALVVSTNLTGAQVSSESVNATSSRWFFSGDWSELSDPILSSQSYRVTTSRANTATIAFSGSAVSVTGIRNITNGHYNVTLDGTTTTFDGHSDWLGTSTLFLQAGLNENVRHSLTITNADDASLAISSLNITHVSGGTPLVAYGSTSSLSTGMVVALVLGAITVVLALLTLAACIHFRRRHRPRRPTVTTAGICSSVFLRELDGTWPLRKDKHRPSRLSRSSDYVLQDLPAAPPLGRDGDTEGDSSVMLIKSSHSVGGVDPMSPAPYLRLPKHSPLKVDWPEEGSDDREWEPERRTWDPARESSQSDVPSVVRELFDAHSQVNSGDGDRAMPTPHSIASPGYSHARRRSRSMDIAPSSHLLHLDISDQLPSANPRLATTPRSATSQRLSRTPLLQSPLRRSRRNTLRTSSGATQLLTPGRETFPSASTIQFRQRPWDEDRESWSESVRTSNDVPPRLKPNAAASEFLERLRVQRTRVERAAHAGAPASNWKPPW